MKETIQRFFQVLTPGTAVLLAAVTVGFVLDMVGASSWLMLGPRGFWHGKVWTVVTHAFIPASVMDLLFNGLFLFMLGTWIERVWSRYELWAVCLLSALATGLFKVAVAPGDEALLFGTLPLALGLLVVWARLFGHEKVLFMGVWEMTVRQCALLIGIIDILVMATCPCFGLVNSLAVIMAAVVGWVYLTLKWKWNLRAPARTVDSNRISRLEL
jgi:membrane associated rhomboid family serine protease